MAKSKKKFKPVQFEKNKEPKIKFSFKVIFWTWIICLLSCFILYMVLANFTDAFIVTSNGNSPNSQSETSQSEETTVEQIGIINPVPQSSNKQGNSYLSRCMFVGDSIISGVADAAGVSSSHVKSGSTFILSNITDSGIEVTDDNLYLMLGYTELAEQSTDTLIEKYSEVIDYFKGNFPDVNLYIMALPPVSSNSTVLFNSAIDDFNSKLLEVANNKEVYYIDTNTPLKDNSGNLASDYADGNDISDDGYDAIVDYILSHTTES